MNQLSTMKITGLLYILLLITGCSSTPTAEVPLEQPESLAPDVNATSGLCANSHQPVVNGATWNYSISGTMGNSSFTNTITSIREDGFTMTVEFDDLTLNQEWACSQEGLLALQMGGGNAGLLTTGDTRLELATQNASGVTYPKEISPGDKWTYSLDFTGTMDIAGQSADVVGDTQSNFTAIGVESITVPAGTFEAMKIESGITITISSTFQGTTVPVTFNGTSTSWIAPGVGWVKSISSSDFGGVTSSETIDLQWYNIP